MCVVQRKNIKTTVHRLPSYLILRQDFYKALLLYALPNMCNYKRPLMHTLLLIIDHITILTTNSLCLNMLRIGKWIFEMIEINEGILNHTVQ